MSTSSYASIDADDGIYSESTTLSYSDMSKNHKNKKSIRYGKVKIYEFNPEIRQSPSCSIGPPIGLGRECHQSRELMSLDEYETLRCGWRRSRGDLHLSALKRIKILRDFDVPTNEIVTAHMEHKEYHKQWLEAASIGTYKLKIKRARKQIVENFVKGMKKIKKIEKIFQTRKEKTKDMHIPRSQIPTR